MGRTSRAMGQRSKSKADRKVGDDEASLFDRAMDGVERIAAVPKPPSPPPRTPTKEQPARGHAEPISAKPPGRVDDDLRNSGVEVKKRRLAPPPTNPDRRGVAAGLDRRTAQRLVRGQFEIEGRIDLHGMTQDEARRSLERFVRRAAGEDKRCVLVITGKGSARDRRDSIMPDRDVGVLRRSLPSWLAQPVLRDLVVAYHNAKPRDGGEGAFYVLLRRRRG